MSMSRHLWIVAHDLRAYVFPKIEDSDAQDRLTNAIRILTAVANAIDAAPAPELVGVAALAAPPADTDRLPGLAANAAAYRTTCTAIAAVAREIDVGDRSPAQAMSGVAWEKSLLDAAMARMDAAERAVAPQAVDPRLIIDRNALEKHLRQHTGSPELAITAFRPIFGGRSRQTALFSVSETPGLPTELVVQRSLPGLVPGNSFVGEEGQYTLLDALHGAGLKVPWPDLVETDVGILGAAFLVTARCPASRRSRITGARRNPRASRLTRPADGAVTRPTQGVAREPARGIAGPFRSRRLGRGIGELCRRMACCASLAVDYDLSGDRVAAGQCRLTRRASFARPQRHNLP